MIISCTDDSSIEPLNTPYVTFSTSDYGQISVPVDGTATVDITIYAATTSGMTLSINVDTNSVADVASYSFNSTAIIPAGSNEVTFPITLSWIFIFELTFSHGLSVNCFTPRLNLESSSSNFRTLTLIVEFNSSISEGLLIFVQDKSVT